MEYYILTWAEDGRPHRIDLNVSQQAAVALASGLNADATFEDVKLIHTQVATEDISTAFKNPV